MLVLGGGTLSDVFWQVGTSATLGLSTAFQGNILAQSSITLNTGAGLTAGRALAINGSVTLDTNNVSNVVPVPVVTNFGTFWKGATGNLWSQNNWSTDTSGADDVNLPPANANVIFSVTGVSPANQNTVLDYNATIGSLTVNDPVPVTISGPNTLTIAGAGTFTGITINPGAGLTTIATNLVLAGASQNVAVNNVAGLLISGQVGGGIGLVKSGTGQLTLTGANTYTGATAINAGTLQLGDGATAGSSIASSGAVTVSAATLLLDLNDGEGFTNNVANSGVVGAIQAGTTTLSGDISGTGSFIQAGSGTTILTGANTYTGLTAVTNGTLQVGDGTVVRASLSPGSSVVVAAPAALAIDLADGKTFANNVANSGLVAAIAPGTNVVSGVISGTGTFQQNGTGTTILTGDNTYTGLTTISRGTLYVNGAVGGDASVLQGTVGGTGTIRGTVTSASTGTVRPGNPASRAGTLSVGGDYLQGSSANFTTSLAAPNTSSLLSVDGRARLNGNLQIDYVNGYHASGGDEFTILNSREGVSSTFANIDNTEAASQTLLTLDVIYSPNSVMLRFVQGSFQGGGGEGNGGGSGGNGGFGSSLTSNQSSIAGALDQLASDQPDSELIGVLNRIPIGQLSGAFDMLSTDELAAIFDSGFAAEKLQAGIIERRLETVRDQSTEKEEAPSTTDVVENQTHDDKDGKHMLAPESKNVRTREVATLAPERRWGFYLNGGAQFVQIDGTSDAAGSDFTNAGANVGADYLLTDHLVLGATAGYSRTDSDGSHGGEITNDAFRSNLYATWFSHGFYINGMIGGGTDSYDTKRQTIGGTARGSTDGTHYTALIGTGYEQHLGGFTFGPLAALQYTTVSIDGFTEHGSLANLRIDDQTENSLQSRLGLRASYGWKVGGILITPEVRAQWQHEFQDTNRGISAGFAEDSKTSFTVHGPEIGRDSLLLDAGASARLSARTSVYAYYTGDLGASNYSSHSFNAGVCVRF